MIESSGGAGKICLIVDFSMENAVWSQNYTLDEIHTAALNGTLSCMVAGINSPESNEIDSYFPALIECIGLDNHPEGKFVSLYDMSHWYRWDANGFSHGLL
jgi:hypothetical protein